MTNAIFKYTTRLSIWLALFSPLATNAQLEKAVTELGKVKSEGSLAAPASLPKFIGQLINVLLSVMGIVFVVIFVYAGYLYLTAAGDKTNVEKSKTLMGQSIIGLIIIFAAYAIATFIISSLAPAAL